jgi:predicted dehydrogenase
MEEVKLLVEMIKSGMIGKVRRVDLWSGKDWGGGTRPTDTPAVPETLDWDLWLGPAPQRPYHPTYLPEQWRRWWDFGTGTLGDMACHIYDPAWWALDLDYPTSVEAQPGPFNDETYPHKSVVKWEFPARGDRPAVTITWSDGENRPPRPPELEAERELPREGGLYYGESGTILAQHMVAPMLIPESRRKESERPERILPRGVDHYQDWIRACKGGPKPLSNFDYAGPMTEAILLGNIAAKVGQKLEWDGPAMRITNIPDANKHLMRSYRAGWTL